MIVYTKTVLAEQIKKHGWHVGDHTYGAPMVWTFGNDGHLSIGKYCSIAYDVTILLGGNHRTDWVTTYPFNVIDKDAKHIEGHPQRGGDVTIGNDVWLGHGCLIQSGVTIGDGACVAAKSVVTRDVPAYAIAAGHPAKILRYRFSEAQIASLLQVAWWTWSDDRIRATFDRLLSPDIDQFIAAAEAAQVASREPPRAKEAPGNDALAGRQLRSD